MFMPGFEQLSEPFPFDPSVVSLEFDLFFGPSAVINIVKEYIMITLAGFSGNYELRETYEERMRTLAAKADNQQFAASQIRKGDLGLFVTMFYREGLWYDAATKIASRSYWRAGDILPGEDSEVLQTLSMEILSIADVLWSVREKLDLSPGLMIPEEHEAPVGDNTTTVDLPDAIKRDFWQYL